jgi:hypothetical protein
MLPKRLSGGIPLSNEHPFRLGTRPVFAIGLSARCQLESSGHDEMAGEGVVAASAAVLKLMGGLLR